MPDSAAPIMKDEDRFHIVKDSGKTLIRDNTSSAILSVDNKGLAAYKKNKARSVLMDSTIDEINSLKGEMVKIKSLLTQLIEGQS